MKLDRMLGILTVLLQQEKVTAPELAERFEVSRRTISRDIEALCQAGIPVLTTQGYGGGVTLAEGYTLDRALISPAERRGLLAGLRAFGSVSTPQEFHELAAKLFGHGAPPAEEEVFLIDLASHAQEVLRKKIARLRGAIEGQRLVTFHYSYQKGEMQRTIEPYRLLFRWSAWYLWGWCQLREDFRLFKLDRLWEPEVLGPFLPRELPLDELSVEAAQEYFATGSYHLTACFDPAAAYRLTEEYGPDAFLPTSDGTLLLERDFVDYQNLLEWVMSFGAQVEVFAPDQLRADLLRHAQAMVKKYQET